MKRAITAVLVACMMLCVLIGCGSPSVEYDAATQTLHVRGASDYAALTFPDEIKDARALKVEGDGFTFNAYLVLVRQRGLDEQADLPGLIDRTAASLDFVRQYLRENAGEAYPSDLAELPVVIKIDNAYGRKTDAEQITLSYNDAGTHREFEYLLALMDGTPIGWEQLGFAWYVGTVICPYTEVIDAWPVVPDLPYYTQCIAGGIDPDNMSAADMRTMYDACARVGFERGLTHWGSMCESMPVTAEPDYSRGAAKEPGDDLLSAFSAASFLAWLDEAHGFEQVSLFCFGQKTFDEAFGTDFDTAYNEWRAWIIETYPAS